MKICYIIAMRAEAKPLIECYGMEHREAFFAPLPCELYEARLAAHDLYVVINGVQHDRDLIGCEAATLATQVAIDRLHPDIVISSGTCGAWQRYGMEVGKVYLGNGAMFHDRRVPGDNTWHTQGIGNYPVWDGAEAMAKEIGVGMGKVTTGSSFDLTPEEETIIEENGGRLKEMEGAAVAFVCSLHNVPVMLVKAVTNLRDAAEDDMDAFHRNLRKASEALLTVNKKIIDYLIKR